MLCYGMVLYGMVYLTPVLSYLKAKPTRRVEPLFPEQKERIPESWFNRTCIGKARCGGRTRNLEIVNSCLRVSRSTD